MEFFNKIKGKFNDIKRVNDIQDRAFNGEFIADDDVQFYNSTQKITLDEYVNNRRINDILSRAEKLKIISPDEFEFIESMNPGELKRVVESSIDKQIKKDYDRAFKKYSNVSINEEFKTFKFDGIFNKDLSFSELYNYEINFNGKTINTKTTGGLSLGRAVAGGLLFGNAGAVLGGLTGKKNVDTKETVDRIDVIASTSAGLKTINILKGKAETNSSLYKMAVKSAQEVANTLDKILAGQTNLEDERAIYGTKIDELKQIAITNNLLKA